MAQVTSFDVVVIGRGITGTSTAWHLAKDGYRNILLVGPERTAECPSKCPGFVTAASIDNITRMTHGHGEELASALLKFAGTGYKDLSLFVQTQGLPWIEGQVYRFAPTGHEKQEMLQAVATLQNLGFKAELREKPTANLPMNTIAIQKDSIASASTDSVALLDRLEKTADIEIQTDIVTKLSAKKSSIEITTANRTIHTEMVVAATHLNTGSLIPNLKDSLVSFADQWISFDATPVSNNLNAGDFWIGHHGHYTIWRHHNQRIFMTGARFLRHWAGVEAKNADVKVEITQHLIQKAKEWFGFDSITNIEAHGILDCRPCDELPIIGPMFGQSRILVGTGYMGSGLALGFAAGKSLAEIIHKGKSNDLHPGLTPARLRSLTN